MPSEFSASAPPDASGVQIQSLLRGLRILELVNQAPDGLALGELARRMDLGKTTVHNLVRTLIGAAYLAKREQPLRYVPGPALSALIGRERLRSVRERAAPVLLELAREFPGSAALLAEATGNDIQVTLRSAPEDPGTLERPLDRFIPPYSNATSLLFLAHWGPAQRRAYQSRHPFWELGAPLWESESSLEACLKQVRAQGYASLDQSNGRAFPVAVPLFSESGELLASLGLAYRSTGKISAATKRSVVERLRKASREILAPA